MASLCKHSCLEQVSDEYSETEWPFLFKLWNTVISDGSSADVGKFTSLELSHTNLDLEGF